MPIPESAIAGRVQRRRIGTGSVHWLTRTGGDIVDEAVTVTEDELGARALGDLVPRGRRFGLEVHVLAQRVTDWFDTRIGRTIQSVAASKSFGQLEPRELYEIAPSLGLSPEERDRIKKAGQGEGLLVTTGRRVWVNLYGHTSPGEFAMANTDVEVGVEHDRRNGDAREAAAAVFQPRRA